MASGSVPERDRFDAAQRVEEDLASTSALSISDVLQMLRRHLVFIIVSLVVCIVAALLYIKHAVPIYEATASLRIDPSRAGSLGLNDLVGSSANDDTVSTEIAILKSDAVAIDTLYSLTEPEFKRYTGYSRHDLVITPASTSLTPAQEGLLGRIKGATTPKQIEGTQLVSVSVRDPDPQMAALLANRTIAAYLRQTFDSRYSSVSQVTNWLSAEMGTLRDRAEKSQRDLATFQEQNDILVTDAGSTGANASAGSDTTTDRLRLLNTSLAQAQAERIVKEAQLRAAATGVPAVLNSMFPSADLTALQAEQSRLYAQYTQLSTKFGPGYPPLAEVQADLAKINAKMDTHNADVKSRLQQEYDAAAANERLLQQQYDEQAEKAYGLNRKQAEYAVLRAEVSSSRELYNTLQTKLQQAGVDAGLAAVNTMLVDTARAPLFPVEPKKQNILGFGAFLGLFVGVGLAFLLEATSDKVQNVDQLERSLRFPLLALVPHFQRPPSKEAGDSPKLPMLATYAASSSREAESFRTLRSSVLLSTIDSHLKTILITSSLPGEGKSTVASNYAVVMAQNGSRVLLVDADLRRPTLHTKFGLDTPKTGLSNLMLGETQAEPFLIPLPGVPNLTLLPAGSRVTLPSEMLGSAKFRGFLDKWKGEFDYVIIDSAPLLIVSDSYPLSTWVDTMLLVVRYNVTPMQALKRLRTVLVRSRVNVAGLILNDMSSGSQEYGVYKYGYGYYN